MKLDITIPVDTDMLSTLRDEYLVALWHAAQANPAPIEDRAAARVAEAIGREIIRRFLASTPALLWEHQGRHADWAQKHLQQGRDSDMDISQGENA